MAGDRRSWGLLGALGAAALLKTACEGPDSSGSPVAEALAAVLADFGPEVVAPALAQAAADAEALALACDAWKSAEEANVGEADAQAAAQAAWWKAMESWQVAELLQVGPAGSSLTVEGGEDLRDRVYSWPTVNRCRVDQETVYEKWAESDYFETSLVNVLGLDALETLLYSPAGVNACPNQVDINADGSWDALGADAIQLRRASQAAALAADLAATTAELALRWELAGWPQTLQTAPNDTYESPEAALNAIFDAAFYLETITKDRKLGYAIGEGDCEGDTCIEDIESPLAGGSAAWVAVNLRAFRLLFTAGEGAGLEDLLRALGEEELADAVLAALDGADAAIAAVELPFDQAMTQDPAEVEAAYAAVKAVCDLLRGDMATVLALQVPAEAAGDAD